MNFTDFFNNPTGCLLVSGNHTDYRSRYHRIGVPDGSWFRVYPDRIETDTGVQPFSEPVQVRRFLESIWERGTEPWENGWFFLFSYEAAAFLTPGFQSGRKLSANTVLISAFRSSAPVTIPSDQMIPGLPEWPELKQNNRAATPGITEAAYNQSIRRVLEYIRAGETYEVNYTWPLLIENAGMPDSVIFNRMIRMNPTPFLACFRDHDISVLSGSPERFFRLDGSSITVQPMKGTRPLSGKPETDDAIRTELSQSEKDKAENLMIVDLMRNDLGRICETGSVQVKNLFEIETHPTVFQMISTIEGTVRADISFSDILVALFPAGSMTGAPKIRTMELIEELEPDPRGFYSGIVGYWDGFSQAEASVLIRCMDRQGEQIRVRVGGGIVADSVPSDEFAESLLKLKGSFRVLGIEPEWIRGLDPSRFSIFRE